MWLVLVVLPSVGVGWFTVEVISARLSERVEVDLENVRRLEAARINDALDDYVDDAMSLASGPHVVDFVGGVSRVRSGAVQGDDAVIGGYDGFDVIDPDAEVPLAELVFALQNKARTTGSEVVELKLVGDDGAMYGRTAGFGWEPYDPTVIDNVLATGDPAFGNAFRSAFGDDRLALVAPITTANGDVVGALVLETRLGPVVDLVVEHEGFGQTSEAHIAQPTAEGDAEFITLLRFERDAAFTKVVPASKGLPINQSLTSPGGQVVRSPDYRAVESILAIETLEATGWGLVVKIDSAEAFAPVAEVRRAVVVAGALTVLLIVVCTVLLLNPLARRVRKLSLAAKQIAAGRYQSSIGDHATDELGELARSIDQLAADLDADIKLRAVAERKLRHQVAHDDLTGIHNRHYATKMIEQLPDTWSVLFLDLDGFKNINDTHGHGVGDEVLQAVAGRLSHAAPEGATVARWGGDEFIMVLAGRNGEEARHIADGVRQRFRSPVVTSVGELGVNCSVGLATAGPELASADDVINQADSAMFAEKPNPREARRPWSSTEREVAAALAEGRIQTWFQPILTAEPDSTDVFGAEALARLRTTDGEIVAAGDFLPAVGDRSLQRELDRHVTRLATETTAQWRIDGLVGPDFQLSVNLGQASLCDPDLVGSIVRQLHDVDLPADTLAVEISEAATELDIDAILELTRAGVAVAIDDVGISNSNFDRLLQIQPRYAKLDRRWLATTHNETLVLDSLTRTCHALDLKMIAEGIETQAQHHLAHAHEVSYVQGFLFGRALRADQFTAGWLTGTPREVTASTGGLGDTD
ncbi:MAG: EAL domain-containing protein [Actinomycetota bacterium]